MEIQIIDKYDYVLMLLNGRITSDVIYVAQEEMDNALKINKNIVLEFSKVDFLSSAGIRFLLESADKIAKINGSMEIRNPNAIVIEVLNMTGLTNFFKIKNTKK